MAEEKLDGLDKLIVDVGIIKKHTPALLKEHAELSEKVQKVRILKKKTVFSDGAIEEVSNYLRERYEEKVKPVPREKATQEIASRETYRRVAMEVFKSNFSYKKRGFTTKLFYEGIEKVLGEEGLKSASTTKDARKRAYMFLYHNQHTLGLKRGIFATRRKVKGEHKIKYTGERTKSKRKIKKIINDYKESHPTIIKEATPSQITEAQGLPKKLNGSIVKYASNHGLYNKKTDMVTLRT